MYQRLSDEIGRGWLVSLSSSDTDIEHWAPASSPHQHCSDTRFSPQHSIDSHRVISTHTFVGHNIQYNAPIFKILSYQGFKVYTIHREIKKVIHLLRFQRLIRKNLWTKQTIFHGYEEIVKNKLYWKFCKLSTCAGLYLEKNLTAW